MKVTFTEAKGWNAVYKGGQLNNIIKSANASPSLPLEEKVVSELRDILGFYVEANEDSHLAAHYKTVAPYADTRLKLLKETIKLGATQYLLPTEYLEYRLYNRTPKEQREYVSGLKLQDIWRKHNKKDFLYLRNKEFANNRIRIFLGEEYATQDFIINNNEGITKEQLISMRPFFAKPVDGLGGDGTFLIHKYSRLQDRFVGPLGGFYYEELKKKMNGTPYLISKIVKSNFKPWIAKKSRGLNTIRFLTLRGNVIGATYKVCRYGNIADNFAKYGNLIVGINLDSGQLMRTAYQGEDYRAEHDVELKHRETIPDWNNLIKFVEKAADIFKPSKLIGFDVATTDNGPVIIDVNGTPGIRLHQIPYQKGFKTLLK